MWVLEVNVWQRIPLYSLIIFHWEASTWFRICPSSVRIAAQVSSQLVSIPKTTFFPLNRDRLSGEKVRQVEILCWRRGLINIKLVGWEWRSEDRDRDGKLKTVIEKNDKLVKRVILRIWEVERDFSHMVLTVFMNIFINWAFYRLYWKGRNRMFIVTFIVLMAKRNGIILSEWGKWL